MEGKRIEVQRDNSDGGLPFWRVTLSVLQACFGVQSDANRQRDFGQRSILPYVTAALIFTSLFILTLVVIVRMVLSA